MKKLEFLFFTLYIYASTIGDVLAQEPDFVNDAPLESLLSNGTIHQGGVLRSIISLLIVVGLIYLTAWFYKKLNKFNTQSFSKDTQETLINKFKIHSSQTLGANRNLYIVEINGKYLVLGVTQSNINLLKEFDKNDIDAKYSTIKEDEVNNKSNDVWISNIENKYNTIEGDDAKRD